MPADWQAVKAAFHAALDVEPAERAAWLRTRPGLGESERREVEQLLAAHHAELAGGEPER